MAPTGPTIKSLQSFLSHIGAATSGTKPLLLSRLTKTLKAPSRLPIYNTNGAQSKSIRILSVDMGIKNLAFCVADVRAGGAETGKAKDNDSEIAALEMNVKAWRRLDVAKEVGELELQDVEAEVVDEDEGPYTPGALSRTAHTLLTKTLLPYQPDIILIERQRWRSGGGAAIQQWTVRVNTLEGMLWAILTALRAESNSASKRPTGNAIVEKSYDIFGVDPKRVGNYWLNTAVQQPGSSVTQVEPKLGRAKAEKKAKINLLKSWLGSSEDSNSRTDIDFKFSAEAESTREALFASESKKSRKDKMTESVDALKKLDDITDCLLQAAAWVSWERNRASAFRQWSECDGQLPDLSGAENNNESNSGDKTRTRSTKTRAQSRKT